MVYDGAPKVDNRLVPLNTIVSTNSFIKNFRGIATIRSLPEINLPDFKLTDSPTEKLYKTLDIEWKSPRKQLDLLIKNGASDWQRVYSLSLLNPSGYPFRVYSLVDSYTNDSIIELGSDGQIGVRMHDVSYGLLTPEDELVLHGSWVQEIVINVPEQNFVYNPPQITVTPPNIVINLQGSGSAPIEEQQTLVAVGTP